MTAPEPMRLLLYSDDRTTRERVRLALGRRPAADVPEIELTECATWPAALKVFDAGGVDLAIMDGESAPYGGLGLARQVKDEIYQAPPVLVLIGRPQDAWLATWSRAEAAVSHPIDPMVLAEAVADLMRRIAGRVPAP